MGIPILYNPNVPENPSDFLATSQLDILNDFTSIFNIFLKNHSALNSATAGNHTNIQLLDLENDPQTGVNEISLYAKKIEGQTDQLFLRYSGNTQELPVTNYQIYSLLPTPTQRSFFTFLPGGIIAYFGDFTTLVNNTLNLLPPLAKKIITVSFCPSSVSPGFKPAVNIVQPSNEFYTAIKVNSNSVINGTPPACYYLVLANF